mmetsp:Transcript_3285/g.3616  ORF Transcript_3285/g.3616 Transcript_3285/m.3616 type:complete len:317 (+) Transcript_3285:34-984(+)
MLSVDEVCDERFLISSSGCEPLELTLCTTQPDIHNKKCSTAEVGFGTEERACRTGLRVYEGARLLAEFFRSSIWRNTSLFRILTTVEFPASAIELGCGCGLAGLTFAVTHQISSVCLTDASDACVDLVRQSIARMKATSPEGGPLLDTSRDVTSEVLWWSKDNVAALLRRRDVKGFDVVMGSDLLYFMVDPVLLLQTCADLAGSDGWIFLSHFMRLPRGQDKLREAAALVGLHIASVPLSCIFKGGMKAICDLGWGSLELIVLRKDSGDSSEDYGDTEDHEVLSQQLGIPLQRYVSHREEDRDDDLLSAMMPDDYD